MQIPATVGGGLTSLNGEAMRLRGLQPGGSQPPWKSSDTPSWGDVLSRFGAPDSFRHDGGFKSENLGGLLRLQYDLSRYHLRVEVLSKVAESAVASLRKLQQNQ
jgi:hypothetical protein